MCISKVINKFIVVLSIMLAIWMALSYGEILLKNTRIHPKYNSNNFFIILINSAEENLK